MIRELFRITGEVSRKRYLATGLALFAVKYTLDYLLTAVVFHRPWRWFPYLDPLSEIHALTTTDISYACSMLALAMPFIWVGTTMTARRIRSAGLPPGW